VPVDPDHSDCAVEFLWHGVLLALGAPANFLAAGWEHGRTIPLTERGQLQIFATQKQQFIATSLGGSRCRIDEAIPPLGQCWNKQVLSAAATSRAFGGQAATPQVSSRLLVRSPATTQAHEPNSGIVFRP